MVSMLSNKTFALLSVLILGIGVVAGGLAIQQSSENRSHASLFNDINKATEITTTTNPDGTMGPATWYGNYSNTLLPYMLGNLDFQVTDPTQGKRPLPAVTIPPQNSTPTPDNTNGSGNRPSMTPGNNNGEQSNDKQPNTANLSSLVLTVKKVEVHLAYLGTPGDEGNHSQPTGTPMPIRALHLTPTPQNGRIVDHWETLNIDGTKTIDLVQLAKTHDLSSLGITKLAAGRYTEVRLYISDATATLTNGTTITLTIPGRANIVRVVEPFVISAEKTTAISLDFDAQNSVIHTGNLYLLKPVVAHFNQKNQE